jgi:hypothetical protein
VLRIARAATSVLRHPSLWATALRQAALLRAPGRLGPAPDYFAFRMVTQYGAPDARPQPADVVGYLRWCRHWDALRR